jgi:hypothetical protein
MADGLADVANYEENVCFLTKNNAKQLFFV